MELGLTMQEASRALQRQVYWAADKILAIENQLKVNNLKLHSFQEVTEETTEIRAFISSWLASQLDLEEGVAPLLNAAYHIGPPQENQERAPEGHPD